MKPPGDSGPQLAGAAGSVADDVRAMVFAFDDKGRQDAVRSLSLKVRELERFVEMCRDDFDCDHDAHRWGTVCRACAAAKLLPNPSSSATPGGQP